MPSRFHVRHLGILRVEVGRRLLDEIHDVDGLAMGGLGLEFRQAHRPQAIRDWFSKVQDGKPFSEGSRSSAEMTALDLLGKEGNADLNKIQVEGVIVKVIKVKFPPQAKQ